MVDKIRLFARALPETKTPLKIEALYRALNEERLWLPHEEGWSCEPAAREIWDLLQQWHPSTAREAKVWQDKKEALLRTLPIDMRKRFKAMESNPQATRPAEGAVAGRSGERPNP
jgi:hypothetical protein